MLEKGLIKGRPGRWRLDQGRRHDQSCMAEMQHERKKERMNDPGHAWSWRVLVRGWRDSCVGKAALHADHPKRPEPTSVRKYIREMSQELLRRLYFLKGGGLQRLGGGCSPPSYYTALTSQEPPFPPSFSSRSDAVPRTRYSPVLEHRPSRLAWPGLIWLFSLTKLACFFLSFSCLAPCESDCCKMAVAFKYEISRSLLRASITNLACPALSRSIITTSLFFLRNDSAPLAFFSACSLASSQSPRLSPFGS